MDSPLGITKPVTEVPTMPVEAICHAKNCDLAAPYVCEACGRPCCPNHVRQIALERRDDPIEMPGYRGVLKRVPSHTETYLLCLRCRSKPFVGSPQRQRATPYPHIR